MVGTLRLHKPAKARGALDIRNSAENIFNHRLRWVLCPKAILVTWATRDRLLADSCS